MGRVAEEGCTAAIALQFAKRAQGTILLLILILALMRRQSPPNITISVAHELLGAGVERYAMPSLACYQCCTAIVEAPSRYDEKLRVLPMLTTCNQCLWLRNNCEQEMWE